MMSTYQDTLVIERTFSAPIEKVWNAHASLETKQKWFKGPPEWKQTERTLDFHIHGKETMKGILNGKDSSYTAVYFEIVPNERLVYAFDVVWEGEIFSVSLVTTEFESVPEGTKMTFAEQLTYLDNPDPVTAHENRKMGTGGHFVNLEALLKE